VNRVQKVHGFAVRVAAHDHMFDTLSDDAQLQHGRLSRRKEWVGRVRCVRNAVAHVTHDEHVTHLYKKENAWFYLGNNMEVNSRLYHFRFNLNLPINLLTESFLLIALQLKLNSLATILY